jgi:hypothetical protein
MSFILNLIIKLAGWATLLALAFKSGGDRQKHKQLEVENANLNEQAQDWANRPRTDDAVINRLRKASAKRKD